MQNSRAALGILLMFQVQAKLYSHSCSLSNSQVQKRITKTGKLNDNCERCNLIVAAGSILFYSIHMEMLEFYQRYIYLPARWR